MRFHADLHVHSKYSRATSRQCDLEHMALWAAKKGISVIGTGDFTHPAWRAELKEKLVPAEPGLFRLRDDPQGEAAAPMPGPDRFAPRFMLEVEISTIYKKDDATRKIHHLVYVPDFESAERLVASLSRIGNLSSDGRPILGLDSRHLLEITLESSPDAYLIPAHIWTPWFAVLGSRSGFDSVTDCYGDLSDHIFAVETGLSSDPSMNWRLSALDRYRLVSNSDAHSPAKLGREATVFDTEMDYFAIRKALETGRGYEGTVEFFPEEGKYHLDGHRKCSMRLTPEETRAHGGKCPSCGQPVTIGVMNRVDSLADRPESAAAPPPTAGSVASLVPLSEILSEIAGTGPNSKRVQQNFDRALSSLGPELAILNQIPVEDIERADGDLLAEAISRLRAGRVIREAGYDGEYGVIKLFEAGELSSRTSSGLLFDLPATKPDRSPVPAPVSSPPPSPPISLDEAPTIDLFGFDMTTDDARQPAPSCPLSRLDSDQQAAARIVQGPLMIVAGPGSGKTRTLTHRIAHLLTEHGVPAQSCLAITFTRRAASEMRERLADLLPDATLDLPIHTFHSLGLSILKENFEAAGLQAGFRVATEGERLKVLSAALALSERKARSLLSTISRAKRSEGPRDKDLTGAMEVYQRQLALRDWVDFDDLVGMAVRVLTDTPSLAARYADRFKWISVDEFQDVDAQQYQLIRLLAPEKANLCVIGDLNQAIYGFRGADTSCFSRFREDYPGAAIAHLPRNYRSSGTIVTAAAQVIETASSRQPTALAMREALERITIHAAPSERAEAEFVVQSIERMIGGHSFFSIDSGRAGEAEQTDLSFSDFAVLYRTSGQTESLREALARSGMPFQAHTHTLLTEHAGVLAMLQTLGPSLEQEAEPEPLRAKLEASALAAREGEFCEPAAIDWALQQLLALAEGCDNDARRFLEALPLATETDGWDPRADRVSLMTLHAAKGLEFPVVFIVGLEDGLLPLQWGSGNKAEMEEERRLFYVGMTRAQDRLFLCRAEKRSWRGRVRERPASPFLRDIEDELLRLSKPARSSRKKEAVAQLELL